MMKTVKIENRQNLLDIAIQEDGTIETSFKRGLNNGLSVTDNLQVNSFLKIEGVPLKPEIVNFYKSRNIKPATAITLNEETLLDSESEGIDYWSIENDFEVQ